MRTAVLTIALVLLVTACTTTPDEPTRTVAGIEELMLTGADLQALMMTSDIDATELEQLGFANGTNCRTETGYGNSVDATQGQYGICAYHTTDLNGTQVIVEWKRFADADDLNGSYQYDSSHYYSAAGLIGENGFGDQSRFRVNNEQDYGGQYNPPGVYFYHLWFTKGLYLVHITTKGSAEEAKERVTQVGETILAKFE